VPVAADFVKYHKSIADELKATQNRIRNLIGQSHWLTDGEHKEAVLRKVLRSCLPESLHVGRGFVCYEAGSSTQLDILITKRDNPTLFKDGELVMVTPDCVEAIVEVKTKQDSPGELTDTLTKLAGQVQRVRQAKPDGRCWAGLFVFDEPSHKDYERCKARSSALLSAIYGASGGDESRVVDCVALGLEIFARYWPEGVSQDSTHPDRPPVWHSYIFKRGTHGKLAPAYFVSNLVWEVSPDIPLEMQFAWFPIRGSKERYKHHFVELEHGRVTSF
jgi:hypothetical protein